MMKARCVSVGTFLLIVSLVTGAGAEPVGFSLNGVTFDDGGTASGGFNYDPTTNTLSNVSITTTAGSILQGATFSGSTSDEAITSSGLSAFEFATPDLLKAIELEVSSLSLTSSNLLLLRTASSTISFEDGNCSPACQVRFITAGSLDLVSIPLPGTLPLVATGLGALGLLGWRRKRAQAARADPLRGIADE